MDSVDSIVAATVRKSWWHLPIVLTLVVVSFIACSLFWYAYPRSDECFRASYARDFGVPGAMFLEYNGWDGRWAGTGLAYLIGSTLDLEASYRYLLLVIHVVTFAGVYAGLSAVFWRRILAAKLVCC